MDNSNAIAQSTMCMHLGAVHDDAGFLLYNDIKLIYPFKPSRKKKMSIRYFEELLKDFEKLRSSGDNYDVIIEAGENVNIKQFHAHSLILTLRSTYFKTALSNGWAHKVNGKIIFKKPNINPDVMEILLKYIYTGIIDLDNLSGLKVLNLLIATDELDFRISDRIIKYYDFESKSFIKEDPYEVLHIVFHLNDPFTSLKDVCLHSICENSEMFFKLPKFLTVDKPILKYLLQRDDLVIKEYIILDFLLEWGMAQMSNTVNINNISNWTTNDYNKMREILQELLPLIRWFQIPSALFHNNRQLYKMILPEALFDDIINFYNNPRIIPNSSNSGIIARCLPKKSDSTNNSYGPVFGNRDLAIKNNVIISEGFNSYPEAKPFVNSQQELFIEDYEVFKVDNLM
ncbi:11948_t:CDS:2 [Funneliformis geosporum]|uniref:11948_t:CDS:1 n=1 Tax=Funneliformis geosporum TaxID=1117311 RepID=A0A9W4WS71_9GLOM|nr:11948_t:CDS:2 [Funneliformis geosporum]